MAWGLLTVDGRRSLLMHIQLLSFNLSAWNNFLEVTQPLCTDYLTKQLGATTVCWQGCDPSQVPPLLTLQGIVFNRARGQAGIYTASNKFSAWNKYINTCIHIKNPWCRLILSLHSYAAVFSNATCAVNNAQLHYLEKDHLDMNPSKYSAVFL